MCRPLTISTELKLAAHFGRDLNAIKSYFWPIVQVKHVNKVFFLHFLLLQSLSGLSNYFGDKDVKRL